MRFSALVTAGTLALLPGRSDAQVSGAIVIGGGPVRGAVVVGAPVIVERHHSRVVVVERYHPHKHKHHKFKRHVVYYDRHYDRYYDGYRPGLVRVDVYYGGGRYYRDYGDGWYGRRVRGSSGGRYAHRDWDRHRDQDWDRGRDRDRDRNRDWDRDRDRHRGDDDRDRDRDDR